MVYITGDTHAEFTRFGTKVFPEQKELTRDDFVIICGDFGGIWYDNAYEQYWLKWLSEKPFTILYVDGNHENFDRLYSNEFEVVDFHGGKAHKIRDNIYHLMRGYVFDLCGKKFFSFGGASSHDIQDGILEPSDYPSMSDCLKDYNKKTKRGKICRINHLSWWKEELPSQEEMDFGEETLKAHNYEVDYVISHSLPQEVCSICGYRNPDTITMYFNKLLQHGLKFREWHCGHYHRIQRVMSKFFIHYEDIERIV